MERFFLVPTGRGKADDMITADEHERVFHWLADLSERVSFDIKTTEAPPYRRVVMQRGKGQVFGASDVPPWAAGRQRQLRAPRAVNDGNGFAFVSHIGDVYPSGFLPIACGNVRERSLSEIYRTHPTFVALRDPERLKGKCGVCEFRFVCGGSRARAYAVTGDPLESDPTCAYVPRRWSRRAAVDSP